jgi:hypothetical protein
MGIEKIRRRMVGKGGFETSEAGSFATIDVTSEATIASLKGTTAWRGTATIPLSGTSVTVSATTVTAANPPLVGLGNTTNATNRGLSVSVNSIVEETSFMIVTNAATAAAQEVVFVIIG